MSKTAKKHARKVRQKKHARKVKEVKSLSIQAKFNLVKKISINQAVSLSYEQTIISLIKRVFHKYKWSHLSIYEIPLNSKDSGNSKFRVKVVNEISKDYFDFILGSNYSIIKKIDANAYKTLYLIGNISTQKDFMVLESYITNEIESKRKGINSELIAYKQLVKLLHNSYTIIVNEHLDALSIDLWAQRKGTIEQGLFFQVKSSCMFIEESMEKFEAKKFRDDLDANPYVSLIKENPLHYIIVKDKKVFGLNQSNAKIPLEDYLKNLGVIKK